MQVPDEMRKCVVFLYGSKKGKPFKAGTAFWAGYPIPGQEMYGSANLFTAHHVLAHIKKYSDDDKVHIRCNAYDGTELWGDVPLSAWKQGDSYDCAVLSVVPPLEADIRIWPLTECATAEIRTREGIGVGDDVFMVGLFTHHEGKGRIEPIVRVGNIAAIPEDSISTMYGSLRAVLIEARSIGGLSGSPVFVHKGQWRISEGQLRPVLEQQPFVLLGIMLGHFKGGGPVPDVPNPEEDASEDIHTGIGYVISMEDVVDLTRDTLEQHAKEDFELFHSYVVPVMDSAAEPESEFDRFEDLTRRLVNTPKAKIDEQRGEKP